MQSTGRSDIDGEREPAAALAAPEAGRGEPPRRVSGAHEAADQTDFERRLHSFGLGAQQRTLLGPAVFADDLEPETR